MIPPFFANLFAVLFVTVALTALFFYINRIQYIASVSATLALGLRIKCATSILLKFLILRPVSAQPASDPPAQDDVRKPPRAQWEIHQHDVGRVHELEHLEDVGR
jgi:hypothetical protein